jgi:hypothetical protein
MIQAVGGIDACYQSNPRIRTRNPRYPKPEIPETQTRDTRNPRYPKPEPEIRDTRNLRYPKPDTRNPKQ